MTGADGPQIIRSSIEGSDGNLKILQSSRTVLKKYIKTATELQKNVDNIKILGRDEDLKEVFDDFLISSPAADLVKTGKIEVRSLKDNEQRSLVIVKDKAVMSYVNLAETIGALSSSDESLVSSSEAMFEDLWEDGEEFNIRTPPMSKVKQTLRDEIGEDTMDDFTEMLEKLEAAKGDGEGIDEITVALLCAARNNVLLYDISKWGEDSGVASKATFSRKKTELENSDLIDTENVPIDIGRPRLRLKFADETLQEASIEEIIEQAQTVL
ncbi:MAG: DUF5821 family protein [Halobacteria archaeon]